MFHNLPNELVLKIISWINIKDYYKFTRTCKDYICMRDIIVLHLSAYIESIPIRNIEFLQFKEYEIYNKSITNDLMLYIIRLKCKKLFMFIALNCKLDRLSNNTKKIAYTYACFYETSNEVVNKFKPKNREDFFVLYKLFRDNI